MQREIILDPDEIVAKAVNKNALHKLLLGTEEYQYLPRWSPSPWNTDLALLLEAYYETVSSTAQLEKAIRKIINQYEGLVPVAQCIVVEANGLAKSGKALGLDLNRLSEKLEASIRKYRRRLASDHRPAVHCWSDGMLGELRNLSSVAGRRGCRPFFPEEIDN